MLLPLTFRFAIVVVVAAAAVGFGVGVVRGSAAATAALGGSFAALLTLVRLPDLLPSQ